MFVWTRGVDRLREHRRSDRRQAAGIVGDGVRPIGMPDCIGPGMYGESFAGRIVVRMCMRGYRWSRGSTVWAGQIARAKSTTTTGVSCWDAGRIVVGVGRAPDDDPYIVDRIIVRMDTRG